MSLRSPDIPDNESKMHRFFFSVAFILIVILLAASLIWSYRLTQKVEALSVQVSSLQEQVKELQKQNEELFHQCDTLFKSLNSNALRYDLSSLESRFNRLWDKVIQFYHTYSRHSGSAPCEKCYYFIYR